jgi:hypothetical protein
MKATQAEDTVQYLGIDIEVIDSLWNLSEDFSVNDAAALVAGYDPAMVERFRNDTSFNDNFHRYSITLKAISNAIINNRLNATYRYESREYGYADEMADIDYSEANYVKARGTTSEKDEVFVDNDNGQTFFHKTNPDWTLSTITRDNLVNWLASRGINTGFFFHKKASKPNYLDPKHSRYAFKLAAAVNAWLALEDDNLIKSKSPKQALSKWLREHAADFKLSDEEGKPNETGIEECAKVANWQDKGGAPKTPSP